MKHLTVFLAFLLLPALALAQSQQSRDVVRAFKKIEAQTEIGVNFRDFSALVGDANLELKMYADRADGRKHQAAIAAFNSAMLKYRKAVGLWELKVRGHGELHLSTDLAKMYVAQYPDAMGPYYAGGAFNGPALEVGHLLPFIWRDAKAKVSEAIALLSP